MKIVTLTENTSVSDAFKNEHGLSLYIETEMHKLLFDVGASGLFAENAKKLGIDLSEVDTLVISHGHYDHGGGLKAFLEINEKAPIYINTRAFENYYSNRVNGEKAYIGLDQELRTNERFVFLQDDFVLDDALCVFSNVRGNRYQPTGNKDLLMEKEGVQVCDDFSHEQNLIIREKDQVILLAGCAHNGIVNILDHMAINYNLYPDHVIGGFHLYNRARKTSEKQETIEAIGKELLNTRAAYHTCHCTGKESYQMLKAMMGNRIDYLSTGSAIEI